MQTAKTLIRLGGCPGWTESLLGAHAKFILSWGGWYNQVNTTLPAPLGLSLTIFSVLLSTLSDVPGLPHPLPLARLGSQKTSWPSGCGRVRMWWWCQFSGGICRHRRDPQCCHTEHPQWIQLHRTPSLLSCYANLDGRHCNRTDITILNLFGIILTKRNKAFRQKENSE